MTIRLDQPKKLNPLFNRISSIKDVLIASYNAGKGGPNQVSGNEREIFIRKYLEASYPKPYRFSSGYIIDKSGSTSGQLDIIAEKINSISFPAESSSDERLHLAEMVSAVISVKSNLMAQWSQLVHEISQLDPLHSSPHGHLNIAVRKGKIPFFAVAYSGSQNAQNLLRKLQSLPSDSCLQALIVLDSNIFATHEPDGTWGISQTDSAFLYFICELHMELTRSLIIGDNMWQYACNVD